MGKQWRTSPLTGVPTAGPEGSCDVLSKSVLK